jgi:hypothetical protein
MSLLRDGLPPSFFTRWRAVATGMFIAGAVILAREAYAKFNYYVSEPGQAPPCYGADEARHDAGTQTIPPRGARDRRGRSIDDRPFGFDIDRLTLAQRVCTAASCGREESRAYRSALFWYISTRLQHTSRLDRDYGDAGLARAREIYSTAFDWQVEQGLRDRYRAKVFRLNDFTQQHDAMAILVLQGGDALRPCRRSAAGTAPVR